jgi:hypothetical protein
VGQSIRAEHGKRYDGRAMQVTARVTDGSDIELIGQGGGAAGPLRGLKLAPSSPHIVHGNMATTEEATTEVQGRTQGDAEAGGGEHPA